MLRCTARQVGKLQCCRLACSWRRFTVVFRDHLSRSRLLLSCRRAILTLLPKKVDLQDIKNWHPVSSLCTDNKLLSRVMVRVVHEDQTPWVPSRLNPGPESRSGTRTLSALKINGGLSPLSFVTMASIDSKHVNH